MIKVRQQSGTSYPMVFFLASSTDHVTGLTLATVTVTLSKNGAAFGAAAGAVSEISSGWYSLAGNATDRNTLGSLALHATATGADPTDSLYTIVPYDPFALADSSSRVDVGKWSGTGVITTSSLPNVNIAGLNGSVDSQRLTNLAQAFYDYTDLPGFNSKPVSDSSGTTTLLTRLSALRAGYLDFLNIGGVVSAEANATTNKAAILTAVGSPMQAGAAVALATSQPNYAPAKAGDAMALTPGERTTLTGVVWAALTSTLTAAGSIGSYLLTQLGLITTGQINAVSGYANGTLSIREGDSYGSTSGQVLRVTKPTGASWPSDLFSASAPAWVVTLIAAKKSTNAATGWGTLNKACVVEDATNVRIDLAETDTTGLALGTNGWTWELLATRATTPALQNTLISGNMSVVD